MTGKSRKAKHHVRRIKEFMTGIICAISLVILSVINASAAGDMLPYASNNLKYGLRKNSSMAVTDTGYVRIMNTDSVLYIEEYNDDFEVVSRSKIEKELSIYGGFYSGSDAYYFVFGENNTAENTDAEVVRVVKYSKAWKRLGAANLKGDAAFAHEVRYPFDYGNVSMAEYNGILYIVTGHEGYVDPVYNQGHQGFLMFAVDEGTMTGSIKAADLWHSFSQHLAINDSGEIYVLEESDGDRMSKVTRYNAASSAKTMVPVLEYGGTHTSAWAIPTYASADAVALSADNVLAVGSSIDQTRYDDTDYSKSYNIYLTVTPMNNFTQNATTFKWLTSDNLTSGYRDVKLTKISDDRFLVMWEQNVTEDSIASENDYDSMSSHVLHYEFLDGDGNVIGTEYKAAAAISECEPVLKNGKVVFYSSDGGSVAYYTIDAVTGAFNKKIYRLAGENAEWDYSDGVLTISGSGELYADMGSNTFSTIKDKVNKLVIGDNITKIGKRSFSGLRGLEELTLGKDIEEIGESAFSNCGLVDVRIPRGTKTIADSAFYGMDSLRKIYIPKTVETIGESVFQTGFYWIGSGKPVVYVTIYCEKDSKAYEYAENEGISCDVPTVTLADKTSDYTGSAIEIDAAVRTITNGEVSYTYYTDEACTKKTTVQENGSAEEGGAPVSSGTYYVCAYAAPDDVFSEIVSNTAKLTIVTNDKEKADNAKKDDSTQQYTDKEQVTEQQLEKGLSVTDNTTSGKYKITGVTKENGSIKNGTVAYNGPVDKKVKKVTIPSSVTIAGKTFTVTAIDNSAFSGCTRLKTITISAGVESIGSNAFASCKALTKITIPAKVKKIGKNAFKGCGKLKNIVIKTKKLSTKTVGKNAFKGVNAKVTVKVPKSKKKAYKTILKKKGLPAKGKVK